MTDDKRPPLRLWIGRHRDGSGRQCIVDTHGHEMAGVKAAWDKENPKGLTSIETVIEPVLSRGTLEYLALLISLETRLGDPRLPELERLLREVAMAAYASGIEVGIKRPASI
jgi:hypothetical protein